MAEDKKGKLAQMLASISSSDEKLDRVLTALNKAAETSSDQASSSGSERPSKYQEYRFAVCCELYHHSVYL